MIQESVVEKTVQFVKEKFSGESSGHDWWHIFRVWNLSKHIAREENADLFIVELAALLHDIADWKFHDGDDSVGPKVAREWLKSLKVDNNTIDHVCEIIAGISFKGAGVDSTLKTTEGKVVQDADRLDAVGAVGIARCFAYGGYKQREIYNPEIKPEFHQSSEAYKKTAVHQ